MISDEIKMAMDETNKRYVEGITKGDATMAASSFTDDAIIFPPDTNMIQGKKAIQEFWKAFMASGPTEVNTTTVELVVSGDYAYERGTGVINILPQGGTPIKQNFKYVLIWKRNTSGWKYMWGIWNNSP